MQSMAIVWLSVLLLLSVGRKLISAQPYSSFENNRNVLSKLFPYSLQKYESLDGVDTREAKDELQNLLEMTSRSLAKDKRNNNNNELTESHDPNSNVNEQFEKHMNLVLQHVAKKLREIYITPRLGRDIDDNIECQRSRPPFAPRLGKKSASLTPRMGRGYDDKC